MASRLRAHLPPAALFVVLRLALMATLPYAAAHRLDRRPRGYPLPFRRRLFRPERAMSKRLRREDGIALVMALGMTVVMIIFVASMVSYVTTNSTASSTSKARVSAYTLA